MKFISEVYLTHDALIVLANEMDANGTLNPESRSRANFAAQLAKERGIPHLVTCGWNYRSDSECKIADAFKTYLVSCGLNAERIMTETNSRDTVGDAVFTRINFADPMRFENILVVTSTYHVRRARTIFDFVYGSNVTISVEGSEFGVSECTIKKELESESAFFRTFCGVKSGDINQIVHILRTRHPFYNGEVYPQI